MTVKAIEFLKKDFGIKLLLFVTIIVATLAFAVSFFALRDLAIMSGVAMGFAIPLIIDGFIIISTASLIVNPEIRWQAWTSLIVATILSVLGNIAHSLIFYTTANFWVSIAIAIIPPVFLLIGTHFAIAGFKKLFSNPEIIEKPKKNLQEVEQTDQKISGIKTIDDDKKIQIQELFKSGVSVNQIAQTVGVSRATVNKYKD